MSTVASPETVTVDRATLLSAAAEMQKAALLTFKFNGGSDTAFTEMCRGAAGDVCRAIPGIDDPLSYAPELKALWLEVDREATARANDWIDGPIVALAEDEEADSSV